MQPISIFPYPQSVELSERNFIFTSSTTLQDKTKDPAVAIHLQWFQSLLYDNASILLTPAGKKKSESRIIVQFTKDKTLPEEGYLLKITPEEIVLQAVKASGVLYGLHTLLQLFPPIIYTVSQTEEEWTLPCLDIRDFPAFGWRGVMLDCSRHFFSIDYLHQLVDNLSMHKMNKLHLHLVDDQGWRLEIKKYPLLTEVGAWRLNREAKPWDQREVVPEEEETKYGGFYTQDQIRELVIYANNKHIEIIPEIEMPAHVLSALAAYPEYACAEGPFTVPSGAYWPNETIYCAGNEKTYTFLEDVLNEVIALFPSPYIHIGGDEAVHTQWHTCPLCQEKMKEENLPSESALQSYFLQRIAKFLQSKQKKLIGWDEIMEGGTIPEATIMAWRSIDKGVEAIKAGYNVILSPTSNCYFNFYQGQPDDEPESYKAILPLENVYSFTPIPEGLTDEEAKHILGAQANLWTEYIDSPETANYMLFPRLCALAEVVWTANPEREYVAMRKRLITHLLRLENLGVSACRSAYPVISTIEIHPEERTLLVQLSTDLEGMDIRYTLNDSTPDTTVRIYTEPLVIRQSTILKAALFLNDVRIGKITTIPFRMHLGAGKSVNFMYQPDPRYACNNMGLVDGIRGSNFHFDTNWTGFLEKDLIGIIDLNTRKTINRLSAGFLQDSDQGIFMPTRVEFSVSEDGIEYFSIGSAINFIPQKQRGPVRKEFTMSCTQTHIQFIKVHATNIVVCPDWHPAAGKPALIFCDEVIVE